MSEVPLGKPPISAGSSSKPLARVQRNPRLSAFAETTVPSPVTPLAVLLFKPGGNPSPEKLNCACAALEIRAAAPAAVRVSTAATELRAMAPPFILRALRHIQHHLDPLSRDHRPERLLELLQRELVGDDLVQLQAAAEKQLL